MEACCNCGSNFQTKTGGYYRHSLDKIVKTSGLPCKEHLEEILQAPFTPSKKANRFLCPQCWVKLNEIVRFKSSLKDFFQETATSSYVAKKRSADTLEASFIKRPRITSTPLKKASYASKRRGSKWDTIITAVRARQYSRAISGLYNATKGSQRAFQNFVARKVRQEMKTLLNKDFPLCQEVNIPNLANFSWEKTISEATLSAPLLLSCLKGSVTTKYNIETLVKESKTPINLKPRIGTALSVLMNAKSPHKSSFLPTLMSVQFWRGRLKRETIKQVSRLGLCVGYEATLSAIDRVRTDFDSVALACKRDIEDAMRDNREIPSAIDRDSEYSTDLSVSFSNIDNEISFYPDMEETVLYSDGDFTIENIDPDMDVDDDDDDDDDVVDVVDDDDDDDDDDDGDDDSIVATTAIIVDDDDGRSEQEVQALEQSVQSLEDDEPEAGTSAMELSMSTRSNPPGFTMCWDNVGKKVISRHPSESVKNRYLNMALGYMAINRVKSANVDWIDDNLIQAVDIPIECFLPQKKDFEQLHYRMVVLVGRIISRHIPWFQANFSDLVTPHITHEYSTESVRKSILVNLGVFNEDPCTTQGAIGIYEKLHTYIPAKDNVPAKTVVFGDGLSCERGNDAQRARSNGLTPMERLEGLEPAVQEFHKEMLLLQDFYDIFYKGTSSSNRGTLCQIKNLFNFRQVKSDIGDNFSHAWELMCTTVESFICLLSMSICELDDLTNRPGNAPDGIESAENDERSTYFENICKLVVDRIWRKVDTSLLTAHGDDESSVLCCGEDVDDDMIGCESRSYCTNGEFFHYSCVGVEPENRPFPWYCSEECRHRPIQPYQYCVCGQDLGTDEPMIGCSRESMCTRKEWYHMKCVGINPDKPPKGNWYCCDECRQSLSKKGKGAQKTLKSSADLVKDYSEALIWAGLNLLCRRDAVREADGDAMLSFWRLDLVHFFANKHPKYTILTHRLLAAVSGWMPERVKFDLIHNRTVNYGGGVGRNLPLDFMNEILNRLFKDLLESAKGRYTDSTIQRSAQIIGPLGEALDHVFDTNVVEK